MNNQISLVDANKRRAIQIAHQISKRLPEQNEWTGYTSDEGLSGELIKDNVMLYNRPNHRGGGRDALIHFVDPVLKEITEIDWGEPITIESDVQERYTDVIKNASEASYDEEVSHTFSKTQSLSQGFKIGAEIAIKTTAGVEYSGVKAGVELSAKLSAEYNRQWGEESTTSDTIKRTLHVPANTDVQFEAVRSVDKQQRNITARCDFDYKIMFVSAPGDPPLVLLEWGSVEEFISVARGFASRDHAGYDLFINNPLTDDEIEKIRAPSDKAVSWIAEYDHVQSQRITII